MGIRLAASMETPNAFLAFPGEFSQLARDALPNRGGPAQRAGLRQGPGDVFQASVTAFPCFARGIRLYNEDP